MKINETVRKDGLRIISCHVPDRRSVQIELIARVGSAYDPAGQQGLFHCFEHMAFKGTKTRSIEDLQSFSAKNLLGRNARTEALGTTYEASAIDRKMPEACEYLCDIYFNSTFSAGELKKEKQPILLEIARRNDNDTQIAIHALLQCLYKENPVRNYGGGTVEGVTSIQRNDLAEEKKKWHIPSNTIAIAIGNVTHAGFAKEINKHIPLNSKKVQSKQWSDESGELPIERGKTIERPDREKNILLLGCKIPNHLDLKSEEALFFFSQLMGGQPNARLWNEVREKRGLAYVVGSNISGNAGLAKYFMAYAEVEFSKLDTVESIMRRVLSQPVTRKREFEELREISRDAFEVVAGEHAADYEAEIWDKIVDGEPVKNVESHDRKRLKAIETLTVKDIENVRKRFIRPERLARVALIGRKARK
jgi:predicted Zn-dependent peptidase